MIYSLARVFATDFEALQNAHETSVEACFDNRVNRLQQTPHGPFL